MATNRAVRALRGYRLDWLDAQMRAICKDADALMRTVRKDAEDAALRAGSKLRDVEDMQRRSQEELERVSELLEECIPSWADAFMEGDSQRAHVPKAYDPYMDWERVRELYLQVEPTRLALEHARRTDSWLFDIHRSLRASIGASEPIEKRLPAERIRPSGRLSRPPDASPTSSRTPDEPRREDSSLPAPTSASSTFVPPSAILPSPRLPPLLLATDRPTATAESTSSSAEVAQLHARLAETLTALESLQKAVQEQNSQATQLSFPPQRALVEVNFKQLLDGVGNMIDAIDGRRQRVFELYSDVLDVVTRQGKQTASLPDPVTGLIQRSEVGLVLSSRQQQQLQQRRSSLTSAHDDLVTDTGEDLSIHRPPLLTSQNSMSSMPDGSGDIVMGRAAQCVQCGAQAAALPSVALMQLSDADAPLDDLPIQSGSVQGTSRSRSVKAECVGPVLLLACWERVMEEVSALHDSVTANMGLSFMSASQPLPPVPAMSPTGANGSSSSLPLAESNPERKSAAMQCGPLSVCYEGRYPDDADPVRGYQLALIQQYYYHMRHCHLVWEERIALNTAALDHLWMSVGGAAADASRARRWIGRALIFVWHCVLHEAPLALSWEPPASLQNSEAWKLIKAGKESHGIVLPSLIESTRRAKTVSSRALAST